MSTPSDVLPDEPTTVDEILERYDDALRAVRVLHRRGLWSGRMTVRIYAAVSHIAGSRLLAVDARAFADWVGEGWTPPVVPEQRGPA